MTHNALQEMLQLLDLVSSPPSELGSTMAPSNIEHESSYSDHSLDISTSCDPKAAILHSNFD